MTAPDLLDRLASHATLGSAPRHELEWLVAHGTLREFAEGDVVSVTGSEVSNLFVLLSGHVAIFVDRGAGPKKVTEWRAGDVTGVLPYSRLTTAPGNSMALSPTTALAIPRELIRDLINECHEITSILVHKMLDRARVFATSDLHDEKMISLGKLSAGLAHELNNPAAAIERSAALLDDRLDEAERATLALGAARLTEDQFAAIAQVREACLEPKVQGILSPVQQAEREDAISDWLEDHAVSAEVAGTLAETSVTVKALDRIAAAVDGPALEAALRWAAVGCSVRALASDIQDAATRISGLVTAVKGFTHMDQGASAEPVDLALNLTNTITVLRSKARTKSVAVSLDVPPDLPPVCGFVGELNQIWANLIDNALDAVPEQGRVDVGVRCERQRVLVSVTDNGRGIPPDVRERMFEPFFTTKPVGKGTGLGLDIVRRLLTHNDAQIEVESEPGRTVFTVSLPIAREAAGARP